MKQLLLSILLINLFSCRTSKVVQETNKCKEGAAIEISMPKLLLAKNKNHTIVMFMDGFDGNTQLFTNDKLIFDKNIETNFSTSYADMTDFAVSEETFLKIQTEAEINNCIEFKLDRRYSAVLVYRFDDKWMLRYSNEKVFSFE